VSRSACNVPQRLCGKDRKTGYSSKTAKAVGQLAEDHMRTVNTAVASTIEDMSVVDFWEKKYLPYCEREWKGTGMRNSTVRGFKQVWK
jgi:hypothetical protein